MRSDPHGLPMPGDFELLGGDREPAALPIRIGEALNGDGFKLWWHAYLVVPGENGTGLDVVEAEPHGARRRPLSEYEGQPTIHSTWDLSDAQRQRICAGALRKIGTPYSALDYGAIGAKRLHIPVPGLREYIANTGHEICSQLVDDVLTTELAQDGVEVFADGRWCGYVTPAGLSVVLENPQKGLT